MDGAPTLPHSAPGRSLVRWASTESQSDGRRRGRRPERIRRRDCSMSSRERRFIVRDRRIVSSVTSSRQQRKWNRSPSTREPGSSSASGWLQ